jgi:hypothetical protein
MREYYLLDTDLNIIDPIESYKSIIWTSRYFTHGDFELCIPATPKLIEMLKKDYYIVRDDMTQAMIIENMQITTDVENGDEVIITGKCLKSILKRRVIESQTTLNGKAEACIRRLITENAVAPDNSERKINKLILGVETGLSDTMSAQYTGDNLGETVDNICKTFGYGYDILLDYDNKKFIFVLYKGEDRSYNQKANPYVIFSNEYENLLTSNYVRNNDNYKNVAVVAGEGEGVNRKKTVVGTATDLERYEVFVDARDISSNEGEINEVEYNKLLIERGQEALAESSITEDIDGEVEGNLTFKLNEDYFLGDIVEVINEYGIAMTPRVTEVIESEDSTGSYTIPTFATDGKETA